MAEAKRDQNNVTSTLGVSSVDGVTTLPFLVDPITGRVLTDASIGTGTVTSVSVVTANGFAGSVATATTTPAITLSTTVTGILSGNGTTISATSTTGSGAVVLATSPTLVTPVLGTPSSGTLTNCTGYPVASLANLGTGIATFLATPSSANLSTAVTDETGSGALVFATSPTLVTPAAFTTGGSITLAENTSIALDPAGSADGKFTGITVTAVAGYTQAFGDLVYLAVADSRWELADADAAPTSGPVALAMVVVAGTDGNACTLLLQGIIRADAKFPTMTVGATQFVGETAGAIQGAIPTGADNIIRTVGYALTADELYFNPSTDWQVTVA